MKTRIFYYIETIADIGIAKSIQENYNCDLYALIDTNKQMKKFFEKQNLVSFSKVFFYRDHVKNLNQNIDKKYLSSFEKKYNINLWLIAYSDRTFYYYNQYHKFSFDEILLILEQECRLFEKIIDEVNPDFVIIKSTDSQQSQLLFELCKAKEVRILTLSNCKFGYRYIISEVTHRLDNYEQIIENYSNSIEKTPKELQEYLKNWSRQRTSMKGNYGESSIKKLKSAIKYLLKVCNNEYRQYWVNFGRTRSKVLIIESLIMLKKFYREHFINKKFSHQITKNVPFVYFPLHFQPERSTLVATAFYNNQIEVISHIARSLPVEFKLLVKEHPMQARNGWREVSYYKTLLNMPNVILIHPSVSNEEILNNCSLVITQAGTLGLDALFHNKPTIVLSDVIYSSIPSVYRLRSYEDFPETIRKALNTKVNFSELSQYANCIIDNSFEHDDIELAVLLQNRFFPGGFVYDVEVSISEVACFLDEHKSIFDNLASQYIKKIKQLQLTHNTK